MKPFYFLFVRSNRRGANAKKCSFRIVGKIHPMTTTSNNFFFIIILILFIIIYLGIRMYQCSKVCLMHDCLVDPNPKARRFALSAPDLAKLPTLQEKFKSDGTVQLRDVESAIVKDLPVSRGELQQMRQGNGSVLYRTIKKARKVY